MTALPANLTIVTLGVRDLDRAIGFYAGLGWERRGDPGAPIAWFKTSGTWLGLYGYDALAQDAGLPAPAELPAFRGITLAVNLGSPAEVDAAVEQVRAAGGTVVKPPTATPWGGYSGYFTDPEGTLWEVAHAPGFALDESGRIDIP